MRIVETKNMWPHMKRPSRRPLALWAKSSFAGQRLLRARTARGVATAPRVLAEGLDNDFMRAIRRLLVARGKTPSGDPVDGDQPTTPRRAFARPRRAT